MRTGLDNTCTTLPVYNISCLSMSRPVSESESEKSERDLSMSEQENSW